MTLVSKTFSDNSKSIILDEAEITDVSVGIGLGEDAECSLIEFSQISSSKETKRLKAHCRRIVF